MIDLNEVSSQHIKLACLAAGAILLLTGLLWLFGVESGVAARVSAVDALGGPMHDLAEIKADDPEDAEGALVRVSGVPEVVKQPRDPQFGIAADEALVLERHVEMLQWRELNALGAPTYIREWVDHPVDSSEFVEPRRHQNPGAFPFAAKRFRAPKVELGGVPVVYTIVDAVPGTQSLLPDVSALPANLAASFRLHDGALYTSRNPEAPQLGDIRVSWTVVPPRLLTVIGRMDEGAIAASPTLPVPGFLVLIDDMDLDAALPGLPNNPAAPWWQRLVAVALAVVGVTLLCFGLRRRLEFDLILGAALATLGLVAALAWLAARPWLALGLCALAAIGIVLMAFCLRRTGYRVSSAIREG